MMVDENQVEGTVRNVAGKMQDAAGGLFGDADLQTKGKVNQVAGDAQATYGETLEQVRDFAADRPLTALGAAFSAGLVLGFLLGRI